MNRFASSCFVLVLVAVLSGCVKGESATPAAAVDASTEAPPPIEADKLEAEPGFIVGTVVDTEVIPIPDVVVSIMPGDHLATTNTAGAFKVGPLEEGTYTVTTEKRGYKAVSTEVKVTDDQAAKVTLTIEPMASDVPYHETLIKTMHLFCSFSIYVAQPGVFAIPLSAPCAGLVDIAVQTATGGNNTNTLDEWTFNFKIENNGFQSLVMEMIWPPQQFGTNGLMQLTQLAAAEANDSGGVTIAGSVYGASMAQPYHDVIHAGLNYWDPEDPTATFYPEPNTTVEYQMIIAGYYGNTTVPLGGSAVFIEFRPTAYLTFFYNRQASVDFSILPDA